MMALPYWVCSTSGWNCTAYSFFSGHSMAATGQWALWAEETKPSGSSAI